MSRRRPGVLWGLRPMVQCVVVAIVPLCAACSEAPVASPSAEADLLRRVESLAAAVKQAPEAQRPARVQEARSALDEWWRSSAGRFEGWQARISDLDDCGVFVANDDCLVLSVDATVGDATVRLSQPDLARETILTMSGFRETTEGAGFDWYTRMTGTSPVLRDLALSTTDAIKEGLCVRVSGRAYPVMQSEDLDPPEFFATFDVVEPCQRAPAAETAEPQDSQQLLRRLAGISARYQRASSEAENVLHTASRYVDEQYLARVEHKLQDWRGVVEDVSRREGRRLEIVLTTTVDPPVSRWPFAYRLRIEHRVGDDPLSETLLRAHEGTCLVVSGTVDPQEGGTTKRLAVDSPTHRLTIESASACGGVARASTVSEVGVAATVGGAAAVVAEVASTAGMTQTVVAYAVTEAGLPVMFIGETWVAGTSLGAAGMLGVAGIAGAGFYFLNRHIMRDAEHRRAEAIAQYRLDAEEYLAFATAVCGERSMNSTCFRTAYREAATFVASSPARLAALTDRRVEGGPAETRWRTQWDSARRAEIDRSMHHHGIQNVLTRVAAMPQRSRRACRARADLMHKLAEERRSMNPSGERQHIVLGRAEHSVLGDACHDLYVIERDYLESAGLFEVWRRAWQTAYGTSDESQALVTGWSTGEHATACLAQQAEFNRDTFLLFRQDCSLRVLTDRIQCVCPQSALSRLADRKDAQGSRLSEAAEARWRRQQRRRSSTRSRTTE